MVKPRSFRIPTELLRRARKTLETKSDTEAIVTSLRWVTEERELNSRILALAGKASQDFGWNLGR